MAKIRQAKSEDTNKIVSMWMKLIEEENEGLKSREQIYPQTNALDIQSAVEAIMKNDGALLAVAEDDENNLVGFLASYLSIRAAGFPESAIYSSGFFVHPDYRGSRTGEYLVRFSTLWAQKIGKLQQEEGLEPVRHVEVAVRPTDKLIQRYTSRGYIPYAIMMYKPIDFEELKEWEQAQH